MLRLRRYRIFLAFAILLIFVLLRHGRSRDWERDAQTESLGFSKPKHEDNGEQNAGTGSQQAIGEDQLDGDKAVTKAKSPEHTAFPGYKGEETAARKSTKVPISSSKTLDVDASTAAKVSKARVALPDKKPSKPEEIPLESPLVHDFEDIQAVAPPARVEPLDIPPIPTVIHWKKQEEHFPVPTDEIIQLPTGTPVKIPRIQHRFGEEGPTAKKKREQRLAIVKKEFLKAWEGYKKYAWKHDELAPVSAKYKDPFCGWAATLVDSLDTLWIMGLKDEFEESVTAVKELDFTTSTRPDIPMFETTIRYMGGLLAAYDISGQKYRSILDKAVELAEILIGAFDTPNRMPMLFYRWKPTFASQPHRSGKRNNLAELGTMSLEFTRLAQLTYEPRYYDAVARITDALYEWQNRGTKLDGVFPDYADASGCNRSAAMQTKMPLSQSDVHAEKFLAEQEEPEGYFVDPVEKKVEKKDPNDFHGRHLEYQILPGDDRKAQVLGWNDKDGVKPSKRDLESEDIPDQVPTRPIGHDRTQARPPPESLEFQDLDLLDGVCEPQGLVSSTKDGEPDNFSMRGGQDSTYEYFPKQYLLLGGLEQKYKKMYLETVDAIRRWMLYRPMIPDEKRDILFTGIIKTAGHPEHDAVFKGDATHLTCFIGGMMGMASRIFDIEGDLEIAKKLADGCVWAYESTKTGIMPESGILLPCESTTNCPWNETAYWEYLDPSGPTRDAHLADYIAKKEEYDAGQGAVVNKKPGKEADSADAKTSKDELTRLDAMEQDSLDTKAKAAAKKLAASADVAIGDAKGASAKPPKSMQKRAVDSQEGGLRGGSAKYAESLAKSKFAVKGEGVYTKSHDSDFTEEDTQAPMTQDTIIDPLRPLSHKEFVESRIRKENLPPGWVSVPQREYILRPEAIESVWYMYRLTGDTTWQEKGWKMWESIIAATSTEYGASSIMDVLIDKPYPIDTMQSFWLAETLKYFYLLYEDPSVVSLDEWVLNTEAHPFKRPVPREPQERLVEEDMGNRDERVR